MVRSTKLSPTSSQADVIIVGAGPVGLLLSILLAKRNKSVILVERWSEHYGRPRAVTYDHEIARILATLGIDSESDPAISYHDELYYWKNANRENIQIVDWQSTSASGWRVRYWFNQPELEARLSNIASQFDNITEMRGWQAVALTQNDHQVNLTIKRNPEEVGINGESVVLEGKYLVGADGANSFVRESLGIDNEDKGYFFDWLILDMIPKTELHISPAQWQLCDPQRPTTIVPGGPGRRRWEYMVLEGESPEEMQKPERAWELLKPWGVTPENAVLERSAVYRFQARWAKIWNKGRCAIAGDAAHLMPPFAGEGMCAGVRDALALAWRLDGILDGTFKTEILNSYTTERIEHAKHYIDFSQELGKIICIANEEQAAERDRRMKAELAARNNKPVPTDICQLGPGIWCPDSRSAGELSVQGVVEANGKKDRFDQAIGQGWVLIGLSNNPADALTFEEHEHLERLNTLFIQVDKAGAPGAVIDTDGTYEKWFKSINAKFVLLRPDFYVAVSAPDAETFRARLAGILPKLHMNVNEPHASTT
jgi:3-(3-hydroxy-phenyl)propionate hydroxylase